MTELTESQATTVAQAIAADNGLILDADALAAVVARLTTDLGLDENRALTFEIGTPFRIDGGKVVDTLPLAHALGIIREHGKSAPKAPEPTAPAAPAKPVPGSYSSCPLWARGRTGVIAEIAQAEAAKSDAAMVAETETYKNPWIAGQINRTYQTHISKYNPALAAKYKAQAGV